MLGVASSLRRKKINYFYFRMKTQLFTICVLFFSVISCTNNSDNADHLFEDFMHPPAEARPFVRWWWNGNHLDTTEIKRELDVFALAGLGGVEINPIAMPEDADIIDTKPIEWLSKDWNDMLAFTSKEVRKRDMITDLIVGSGWPFGGEFLTVDETSQRVFVHREWLTAGSTIEEDENSLCDKILKAHGLEFQGPAKSSKILFVQLIRYQPVDPEALSSDEVPETENGQPAIIDLTGEYKWYGRLNYEVGKGSFLYVYGMVQKGHREVMHGALGASGPVMDHYRQSVTSAYLSRLLKISEDTGIPLSALVRALFCDSIELGGANWTEYFNYIFLKKYGYQLEPYYPFIFYLAHIGYEPEMLSAELADQIKRVRYDYNRLLVDLFLENFTKVFHDFCAEQGLLSRYQAYGSPLLMGMFDGYLIPDIPESNNWIYSGIDMEGDEWDWNQLHGYMSWNVYAASAGHLKGRKIISCESMTNTQGVFMTSLEEIKRHDDMNFISGINHSIMHGYNYSPPKAGFPGWVRYGAYFSDQNTWWPYFPKWVEYNSRLSSVFQQTTPVKQVAILAPEGDVWSETGLTRMQLHTTPWYCNRLWESLSQAGSSCDYISESIICDAKKSKGRLMYGNMSYQMIILCSVRSLHPETAIALQEYVKQGGKVVILDSTPSRSLHMQDATQGDETVQKAFTEMIADQQKNVFTMDGPATHDELLTWTTDLLAATGITPDVQIERPDKDVFQIRKSKGDRELFFFVNSHLTQSRSFKAVFPTGQKTPWVWNPEDGTRKAFPYGNSPHTLDIELKPLQSLLLVFEPDTIGVAGEIIEERDAYLTEKMIAGQKQLVTHTVKGQWHVSFEHCNGEKFKRIFDRLEDFGRSGDPQLNTFAGLVTYTLQFDWDTPGKSAILELSKLNRGVVEVYVNGKSAGICWYGRPTFDVNDLLFKGQNTLEIKYTTVLSNYCRSLKENPAASRWASGHPLLPCGLTGDVLISILP